MRLRQLFAHAVVRGLSVGRCVDGSSPWEDTDTELEQAHAHIDRASKYCGWICVRYPRSVMRGHGVSPLVLHELAHLISVTGHDDRWRATMRELGQPIPAAYRKKRRN